MNFRKYIPHGVVFLSSMSVMIVELVASRLVSKYFGNSLYTWTGIIGIVLGGISLGNFIGGKLADRFPPQDIIRPILTGSALLVLLILVLDVGLSRAMGGGSPVLTWGSILRILSVISVLFLLPSAALGMISPVMAKYALLESSRIGSTVGGIYAVSSFGSILGTFLSGFVLIPLFGIRTILVFVSAILLLLTIPAPGKKLKTVLTAGIIAASFIVLLAYTLSGDTGTVSAAGILRMEKDTGYSHISVRDIQSGETVTERMLVMDGLVHNKYDPRDPDKLLYDYEDLFRVLTEFHQSGRAGTGGIRALTVGGGAFTFPSYLERHFNPADNTVVEIDPDVIETAFTWFGISRDTRMNIVAADGRNYVQWAEKTGRRYDIVYIDAFSSYSVPYHLTTEEFFRTISGTLDRNGLVLVNCIDIFSIGKFLNALANTMRSVFPEFAIFIPPSTGLEYRATFVLAAMKDGRLPADIVSDDGVLQARRLTADQLADLRQRNGTTGLTDYYAPVENLIAPVFLQSVH